MKTALGMLAAATLLLGLAPTTLGSATPVTRLSPAFEAITIGSNSCQGDDACTGATGPIGDNACNGDSACENTDAAIGNGSCNDTEACAFTTATIGHDSCNGPNACADFSDPVGDCQNNAYTPADCVQPDAMIRRSGGPRVGDDIYNLDATNQTIDGGPRAYRQGAVRWFYIYLENDGLVTDSFTVMGCHQDETLQGIDDDPGYTVRFYRPSGADITAAVEAGTFVTPLLAPGNHWSIRARVQIGPGAAHGSELYRLFTITSVDNGAKQDSAKFEVSRK